MLNFAQYINLPLVWGGLIALAVLLYTLLDGFDLGVGILFPFAPSDVCRDKMMNSIAPFWDGNETWLILGGGGLFAAFPLAYAILMPAVYMPALFMLIALIFRGVAFEFRFKADLSHRKVWDFAFHFGSLVAAFMQGVILGAIVQGIEVSNLRFAGNSVSWLSAFSVITGSAVVFAYALIGATWLIMKTEDVTKEWAYRVARYVAMHVVFFVIIVCIWTPFLDREIFVTWFNPDNIFYVASVPILTFSVIVRLIYSLSRGKEAEPFLLTIALFVLCFIGLVISLWPYVIPRSITWKQAAAVAESQSLMLIGAVIVLPVILVYTGYCYYVFRGKAKVGDMYY